MIFFLPMQCPKCKSPETRVVDSRSAEDGRTVRRRRECEMCSFRFTTYERIETTGLIVVKNNGTSEPYSHEKLERSVWIACGKRPVTSVEIDAMLSKLEERWAGSREITSRKIGIDLMEELKKLDHVAYIRFASVYRSFEDVEDFQSEIAQLFEKKKHRKKA